jgi:hypothetical protein
MRKVILSLLILILFCPRNYGQLFGGEKVTIYGIDFKAKEVTGQSKFTGVSDVYRTKLLNPFIIADYSQYLYSLGSYRTSKDVMEAQDLFNMSLQNNDYPFLDIIDFDFYKSLGFALVESKMPSLLNDLDYLKLRSYLSDSTQLSIKEKKRILFSSKEL